MKITSFLFMYCIYMLTSFLTFLQNKKYVIFKYIYVFVFIIKQTIYVNFVNIIIICLFMKKKKNNKKIFANCVSLVIHASENKKNK